MSRKIGKYDVAYKLGQGAMGAVYKAVDTEAQEEVAIKILSEELIHNEEAQERFKREIRQALQLEHPNIIRSLDTGIFQDRYYYVMEYVRGRTLKEILKKQGSFKEFQAVAIILQLTDGLEFAGKYGIVHRDIKPDNIMFSVEKVAKISDMGLAKSQDSTTKVTVKGTVLGTPQYMSPEQATGKEKVDHRSDIYSLGATFYHMLAGSPPFVGKNPIQVLSKVLNSEPTPVRELRNDVSPKTEAIVKKMMAKKVAERYQSCADLKKDLLKVKETLTPCDLPEVKLDSEPIQNLSVKPASEKLASPRGPVTKSFQQKPPRTPLPIENLSLTDAKNKQFKFSFVPTPIDIQFCKIVQGNKLLGKEKLIEALNRQEEIACFGGKLSIGETLVSLQLLDATRKASIEQARLQHEWLKNNLLFGKIALQYNFVSKANAAEVQQMMEKGRKEPMNTLIGETLFQRGWINEEQCRLILAKEEQIKQEKRDKLVSQIALQYGFATHEEIEQCGNYQLNELREGKYIDYCSVMRLYQFIQNEQSQALLRSLARYEIVEIPILQSLCEQLR